MTTEKPHRMWARNLNKRRYKRIVWDIETWGLDARNFAFGASIYVETGEEKIFFKPEDARAYFESEAPCVVYAHNQFGFDLWSIVSKQQALEAKKIAAGTNLYEITINRVRYRDTKHLFPLRLGQLGAALGFPKGETPEDYITGNRRKITKEDIEYCVQDCRILVKALKDLETNVAEWVGKPVNQVALPLTTASLAYRIWSETCWPEDWGWWTKMKDGSKKWVKGVAVPKQFNHSARESYAGGRVQVLCEPASNQYDVISYDANSMFPSVQVNYDFPNIKTCRRIGATAEVLEDFLNNKKYVCWANVDLESMEVENFLPNRNELNRLDWNQPNYSGWLAEPELKYALHEAGWELNDIRELHIAKAHNTFGHVEKFYDKRLEAKANNDPREIFYKLILNSGYGKFAQRATDKRIENPDQMNKIMDKYGEDYTERFELRFYDNRNLEMPYFIDKESHHVTPDSQWFGYASFITSAARTELQKAIAAAGEYALYCDTDSVFMNVEAQKQFEKQIPLGDGLGKWKIETDYVVPRAKFWEPKCYSLFGESDILVKVKHKGCDVKDRFGNFLPNAGDLTKPQISTTTTKLYTSLRRNLEPGVMQVTEKISKRYGNAIDKEK